MNTELDMSKPFTHIYVTASRLRPYQVKYFRLVADGVIKDLDQPVKEALTIMGLDVDEHNIYYYAIHNDGSGKLSLTTGVISCLISTPKKTGLSFACVVLIVVVWIVVAVLYTLALLNVGY